MEKYKFYVGGEFRDSAREIAVINPLSEEPLATIYEAGEDDLDFCIQKAKEAQILWRAMLPAERAKILRDIDGAIFDNLQTLADLETKEIGKALKESLFVDVPLGGECFKFYASFLESLEDESAQSELGIDLIQYDAFGVCAVYLPYNVPMMLFGFSCAAALAAGNAIIVKPSTSGALSLLELAKHIDKLDIPKGLISFVTGKGSTVGNYLAAADVDLISFTGSRNTLKKIVAQTAQNPKKLICELGGCNMTIVFSDAQREDAMQNILGSSFMKQGQMCIGTSFVLVEEDIYKDFVRDLARRTAKIKLGDPFDPMVGMGPLPSAQLRDEVHARIEALKKNGAEVIVGGEIPEGKGYFYPPTIIEVKEMVYEEFFAPVILIKPFKKDEVEEIVSTNPTGLVMQIWSMDLTKANALAKLARCGTVWVNSFAQMSPQTPFGGAGKSGWGRNLGKLGFFEYVQPKHVGIALKKSPVDGWFGV